MGGVGSGLAGPTATACENLLAAVLRGDGAKQALVLGIMRALRLAGRFDVLPQLLQQRLRSAMTAEGLQSSDARRLGLGSHADVSGQTPTPVHFEVKAQLTKRMRDLIEADYIRGDTAFLSELARRDRSFRNALSAPVSRRLIAANADQLGLDLRELLLADLAVLPHGSTRRSAGATNRSLLKSYMHRKYLVQIAMDGVRVCRLEELPLAIALTRNQHWGHDVVQLRDSVTVRISLNGVIQFRYYIYSAPSTSGRHKLPNLAVPNSARVTT